MNAKVIPAPLAPDQADTPLPNQSGASQVAMVVMLVPIPASSADVPPAPAKPAPTYVDSNDHVWLLVDKASPMAAVFQQITAADPQALPASHHPPMPHHDAGWPDAVPGQLVLPDAALEVEPLSRREIDVLRLMADGRSNKEIAQSLILALSTIKMHIKHIYGKLGVKNRVQAVAQARILGLLPSTAH